MGGRTTGSCHLRSFQNTIHSLPHLKNFVIRTNLGARALICPQEVFVAEQGQGRSAFALTPL